jgi:hypothetical protein
VEKRLILRGFGAGAVAGLLAFIFARIFAEAVIQASINYESGRDAVQATLNKAAGLPPPPPGADIFSRTIQGNVGVGVGLVFFGAALGGLFAVTYILVGRHVRVTPRVLAVLLAGAGFLAMFMVPFVKYPANPPAIGNPDTIRPRGLLYLAMVVISVGALLVAVMAARRLRARLGSWNAAVAAGIGFAVLVGIAIAFLPPYGHLHANVIEYGRHLSETPPPLRNGQGRIVYPGFPADVLFRFRLYSILNQLILWGSIGFLFGLLAEKQLGAQRAVSHPVTIPPLPG